MPCLIHQKTGAVLAQHIIKADSLIARLQGLIGKKDWPSTSALWIYPCRGGIHTCFMSFAIDVLFVTRLLQVSYIRKNTTPWSFVHPPLFSKTHSVFELKAHALKPSIQLGDTLYVGD